AVRDLAQALVAVAGLLPAARATRLAEKVEQTCGTMQDRTSSPADLALLGRALSAAARLLPREQASVASTRFGKRVISLTSPSVRLREVRLLAVAFRFIGEWTRPEVVREAALGFARVLVLLAAQGAAREEGEVQVPLEDLLELVMVSMDVRQLVLLLKHPA